MPNCASICSKVTRDSLLVKRAPSKPKPTALSGQAAP